MVGFIYFTLDNFLMKDEDQVPTTSNRIPLTPPTQHQLPQSNIPSLPNPRWTLAQINQTTSTDSIPTPQPQYPFSPRTTPQTPVANVPQMPFEDRFSSLPPDSIMNMADDNMVNEYIENRLLKLNKQVEDKDYEQTIQKIVLELISKARLTTTVFNKLRGLAP